MNSEELKKRTKKFALEIIDAVKNSREPCRAK